MFKVHVSKTVCCMEGLTWFDSKRAALEMKEGDQVTDKEKSLVDYTIKLVKAGWPDGFIWDRVKEKADRYEQKDKGDM